MFGLWSSKGNRGAEQIEQRGPVHGRRTYGVYSVLWGGRSDASIYPFAGITNAFPSCSSILSFFLRVLLWAASSAFNFAFFSSIVHREVNCSRASGVIVSPEAGRFSLNFVRGPALYVYHIHSGAPSVRKPAVLTATKSP